MGFLLKFAASNAANLFKTQVSSFLLFHRRPSFLIARVSCHRSFIPIWLIVSFTACFSYNLCNLCFTTSFCISERRYTYTLFDRILLPMGCKISYSRSHIRLYISPIALHIHLFRGFEKGGRNFLHYIKLV